MYHFLTVIAFSKFLSFKSLNDISNYSHAKQALFELIVEKFETVREKYNYYINNLEEVDALLKEGAAKASIVANGVLERVREKLETRNRKSLEI